MDNRETKVITSNRKAFHEYYVLDRLEAGISLLGTEVKSLRQGKASLADSYATIDDGEMYLLNLHIPQFNHASVYYNHKPRRKRKLLLHKSQIRRLYGKLAEKGLTLIPLKLYFSGPYIKVELGLCKGKKQFDKREAIKAREAKRSVDRIIASHQKYS
ncbi:MAG: SsrA-binding protein SmpB [Vulcanimicrobiota bacterium]